MAALLGGLLMATHRIMHVRLNSTFSISLITTAVVFFFAHCVYLSLYRFDYGYNILAGVVVGAGQNFMWLGWVVVNFKRPYAWKIMFVVFAMFAGKLFFRIPFKIHYLKYSVCFQFCSQSFTF